MNRSLRSGAARWLLLPAAVLGVACADGGLGVDPVAPGDGEAQLSIFVQLGTYTVDQLSVEVSAADMDTLYFNLAIEDRQASGVITVRAGSDRTITLRAFDGSGTETHRGSTTVDIVEGSNPAVSVVLEPLGEGDPMEGIVGEYQLLPIVVEWPFDSFWEGHLGARFASTQLSTRVVDGDGRTLDVPIHWAGPGVSSQGLASAPPWDPGASTMTVTATAIAGTQARQTRIVFQDWAPVEPAARVQAKGRTCGLNEAGEAFCWGAQVLAPSPVDRDRRFTDIAPGDSHSCAVAEDGSAWCWGRGDEGQLGDGESTSSSVPVRVASDASFTAVGVGFAQGRFSCGLTEDGEVWCWGWGELGQLGNGAWDASPVPVRVASEQVFRSLTAGFAHACAITVDDDAYCWGNAFNGKVGYGGSENQNAPVPVAGELKFESVSAGIQVTCGLTREAQLFCWGWGTPWFEGGFSPVHVPLEQEFTAISVGGGDFETHDHMCGVTGAGTPYCWGANDYGQLGNGSTDAASGPVPVAGGMTVRQVSAGVGYSCAATTAGEAYCWGLNRAGQLGDLSRESRSVPVRVAAPTP